MAVQPLASQVGVAPACRALGVPRASFYRRQRPAPGHQQTTGTGTPFIVADEQLPERFGRSSPGASALLAKCGEHFRANRE